MSTLRLTFPWQQRHAFILVATLAGYLCMLYASVRMEIEPMYVIAITLLLLVMVFAMHKWPIVILAGLLFVGNLKGVPAQGVSLRDPTMILLLLLAGAIFLDMLLMLARFTNCTVGVLFKGQSAVSLLFFLFCVAMSISLLYTPSAAGVMKVARFDTFEVLVFFAPILLLKKKQDVRQLFGALVILAIVLTAQIVKNLEHPTPQILNGNDDITQIGASELLGFALLICLYGELFRSHVTKYICGTFFLFGVITCAARSTIVALLISLGVSACAVRAGRGMFSRKAVLLGLALAVVVTIPTFLWLRNVPAAQQKVRWKMAEVEAFASGSIVKTGTINLRLEFYKSALDAFKEHPMTGLGAGGWSIFYYGEDMLRNHPHNFVLEVGAEQGVIGLSLLIVLLTMLLRSAWRLLRSDPYFSFLFPMLLFSISYNLITGTVESRGLWCICGLVAATSRMSRQLNGARSANPEVARLPFAETP